MAQSRTLKLGLLADVAQFGRGMAKATGDVKSFSGKSSSSLNKVSTAFKGLAVAAGYAALRMGTEAVKAAAEDELSQKKLAKALKNTTNATATQINSTEKWITSQQLAYGISDTKLRPALANLARATRDVAESQRLTNLAMDIAAATGKDVESVSLALAKAYNGNMGALTRLGVPLDEVIIKNKDFNEAVLVLSETFGGSASAAADTYAGKLAKLSESTGELKESVGVLLLPVMQKFADWATNSLVPTLQKVADGFAGKPNSVSNKLAQVGRDLGYAPDSGAYNLGKALRDVTDAFGKLFATATGDKAKGSVGALQQIADSLTAIADGMNKVSDAWDNPAFKAYRKTLGWTINPGKTLSNALPGRAIGGSVMPGQAYRVGEFGPETFVPTTAGRIVPKGGTGGGNTFIFNGVIDGESARRSIERLLQDSSRRTGAINLVGGTL